MNETNIINNTINSIGVTNCTGSQLDTIGYIYITFKIKYIFIALIKLGLSVFLSFIISFERELHSHPGGACTHILVGLGSCLFTMISVNLRDKYHVENADPARTIATSGDGNYGDPQIHAEGKSPLKR